MRIQQFLSDPSSKSIELAQAADGPAPRPQTTAFPSISQSSSYVPAPELTAILAQVRQQPLVRSDLLAQVAARLAAGTYDTGTAAQQTAASILAAPE